MNFVRPAGMVQAINGEAHQQISERRWIQHACVEQHRVGPGARH
ncbi:hypothetical protein PAMC26510_36505 [Caballeronia sordidicola]|uniref:Uncharacterized protein n=1 Tax=Caballeronia sordidicola TaxID=196367 RepID=A0A242M457_CABSO|nr:hypothetical protein PAMC26510_36505 [Caballeronia sordidicola]